MGKVSEVTYARGLVQTGDRTYAFLQPDGSWGWSNAGVIVGDKEAVLIDTFFDLKNTHELLESIRSVTSLPIRTLVNTHHNGDHCWGNQLVEDATVVGHHRCRTEMLTSATPSMLDSANLAEADGGLGYLRDAFSPFDFSGIEITPPTITFEDQFFLHPGGTLVRLAHYGPCHTLGDIVAWVPDERVLYCGDIAFIGSTPLVWEGSLLNWIQTIDALIALKPRVVVPGHGPVTDIDGLRSMQAYLSHLVAHGSALKEKGLTPEQAAREIDVGSYAEWKDSERIVLNLMRLWLELDGHRATSRINSFEAFDAMAALAAERG